MSKAITFYQLDSEMLQEVNSSPHLGTTISNDLQWKPHITSIVKKANSTLGFLRLNLKYCPVECKRLSYFALVALPGVWCNSLGSVQITRHSVNQKEKMQRQAARYINKRVKWP